MFMPWGSFGHPTLQCSCWEGGPRIAGYHGNGPKIEGFVIPCLLVLLKQEPSHGYELMEKLEGLTFNEAIPDPGVVYRHLRRLEEDGVVVSRLESGNGGPARKVYSLTEEGERYLQAWVASIRKRKRSIEDFLNYYEQGLNSSEGK